MFIEVISLTLIGKARFQSNSLLHIFNCLIHFTFFLEMKPCFITEFPIS